MHKDQIIGISFFTTKLLLVAAIATMYGFDTYFVGMATWIVVMIPWYAMHWAALSERKPLPSYTLVYVGAILSNMAMLAYSPEAAAIIAVHLAADMFMSHEGDKQYSELRRIFA